MYDGRLPQIQATGRFHSMPLLTQLPWRPGCRLEQHRQVLISYSGLMTDVFNFCSVYVVRPACDLNMQTMFILKDRGVHGSS